MIERKFVANNMNEFRIKEFVKKTLGRVGLSEVKLKKTPLGEKIIISTSRPGLVVGRSGANISALTVKLKEEFSLENPQIEIEEITEIGLDANIIAELIGGSLERFGSSRFKGIGYRAISDVINSGAIGVEIIISGKIPGSRAKNWRFYKGYLKKCGEISISGVQKAYSIAKLKTGIVGIKVSIMPSTIKLPDNISLNSELQEIIEEVENKESEKINEEIVEKLNDENSSKEVIKKTEIKVNKDKIVKNEKNKVVKVVKKKTTKKSTIKSKTKKPKKIGKSKKKGAIDEN